MTTDFPRPGDNQPVSLRHSNVPRFDAAWAERLRETRPATWAKLSAAPSFRLLLRVARQGGVPVTRAEEVAVRRRERWAARHHADSHSAGVVDQIKWLVVGQLGETNMKTLALSSENPHGRQAQAAGGGAPTGERATPARGTPPPDDDGLYVRTADVRDVRREKRPHPTTGVEREVVVVEFVASTEVEDSHESIVRSNWDLTRFLANNVLLWMHNRWADTPAVGNVENLHKEGTTHVGRAVFDDTTEFDRDVAQKYEKGVLKGFSIGFYPRTVRFEKVEGRDVLVLDDIELLEVSCVNVPSNPEALARKYDALRRRARAALPAQTRTTTTTLTGPTATGDTTTMKHSIKLGERDVKRSDDGVTCDATCPACKAEVGIDVRIAPTDVTKSAEYAALADKLTSEQARAVDFETKLGAAEARAKEFEGQTTTLKRQIVDTRVRQAEAALTERAGKKVWPKEIAHESKLARSYLVDLTPDADGPKDAAGNPTRTVGERLWAERLQMIDERPELGVVTEPVTTQTGANGNVAETDPAVRAASGHNPPAAGVSVGGQDLAAILDKGSSAA